MIFRIFEMLDERRRRKSLYSTPEYWNGKAKARAGKAASMWPNNNLNPLYEKELHAEIQSKLGKLQDLGVLDLGCGTGRLSYWFAAQGARVTGIDFSRDALAIALNQSSGENPVFREGSVLELAETNIYDVMFTWGVITFACRDKAELLEAMVRMRQALRPGGRLLLTEPVHRGFLSRVLDLGLNDFLAIMREAGFEIRAVSPMHFWPMRLALCFISWPAWMTTPLYHLGQTAMKIPGLSRLGDYRAILAIPIQGSFPSSTLEP